MSKQLLHSHSSDVIIAALNHRAFAVVASSNQTKASQNNAIVYELMAPTTTIKSPSATAAAAAAASKSEENDKSSNNNDNNKSNNNNNEDNEIQAVCCTQIDSNLVFAVSRGVKTLSLYSIPSSLQTTTSEAEGGSEVEEEEKAKILYPSAIYNLPKRARCLAFTTVDELQVIVAGDLSGDAIAFPVPTNAAPLSLTANENEDVQPMSTPKRLMLGHTASMLTGLNIVSSSSSSSDNNNNTQQQFVLTADRDEKVRISYFPETHIIHGYLLGHSSFISCMDAIFCGCSNDDDRALCLTGSGDGTSRLWDYRTCKEVGMLPVVIKTSTEVKEGDVMEVEESEGKGAEEETDEAEENDGNEEEEAQDDFDEEDFGDAEEEEESIDHHTVAVPLSVSLHPDATFAAVARDEIPSIDIHPIPPVAEKSSLSTSFQLSNFVSLHKKQTLECKSQPLAVRFTSDSSVLVLAREPEYLLHFGTSDGVTFTDISQSSCLTKALCKVAQSENITMPKTTLERNDHGQCTLQKKEDRKELTAQQKNAERGGLHWNDPGRKVTAKKAQARKRQRKMERKKEEGVINRPLLPKMHRIKK